MILFPYKVSLSLWKWLFTILTLIVAMAENYLWHPWQCKLPKLNCSGSQHTKEQTKLQELKFCFILFEVSLVGVVVVACLLAGWLAGLFFEWGFLCIVWARCNLLILLSPPTKCWNYRCLPSHPDRLASLIRKKYNTWFISSCPY